MEQKPALPHKIVNSLRELGHRLAPIDAGDEDLNRQARIASLFAVLIMLAVPFIALLDLLIERDLHVVPPNLPLLSVCVGGALVSLLLIRSGQPQAGVYCVLAMLIFTAILAAIPHGLSSFTATCLATMVVMAAVLAGGWGIVLAVVASLAGTVAAYQVSLGQPAINPDALLMEAALQCIAFLFLGFLTWLSHRSLVDLADRARRQARELQETTEQLQVMTRLKSQFMASTSHELRTPLNAIIGFSQVMLKGLDGPLTESQHMDLVVIHENGQRLLKLINSVLDISKIQAGRMDLAFEPVHLQPVIKRAVAAAAELAREKPVELHQHVPSDLPPVWGDEARLHQVILNLLSNAVKFTDAGSISLRVWSDVEQVTVSVADTGIGIAPEHQAFLFEEFRQVDGSLSRRSGGIGLGLPISRHLVELHGGRIWVESTLDEGSTFGFTVPIAPPEDEEDEGEHLELG